MSKRQAPRDNDSNRSAPRLKLENDLEELLTLGSQATYQTRAGPSSRNPQPYFFTRAELDALFSPQMDIENIYPDGDLILNFRYCIGRELMANLESGSGTEGKGIVLLSSKGKLLSKPSLRVRVSSAVISVASLPLKLLVSDPVSQRGAHDHPLVRICPPRVWGFRESPSEATIIFNCDRSTSNSVENALKILFLILHFKTTSLHRAPLASIITRIAELGWVFDCIGPLLSWMQLWIAEQRQNGNWARTEQDQHGALNAAKNDQLIMQVYTSEFAGQWMVMSWVVGDERAFERSSRDYLFSDFSPPKGGMANLHSDLDLGIVTRLYEDLCSSRQAFIRGIYTVLNETFTEACANAAGQQIGTPAPRASSSAQGTSPGLPAHVHALILGSLVQSVMSIWHTNFPLEPIWDLAIQPLWERVEEIARVLENACAQLHLQQNRNVIHNPVVKFKGRMDEVFRGLKGLKLKDYNQGAVQLMDFQTGHLL